jgi:hypothetical protein
VGGYRRDHLRALGQRVEVDENKVLIMGSKSELLTPVAASSAKTVGFLRADFVPKWRANQINELRRLFRRRAKGALTTNSPTERANWRVIGGHFVTLLP